MIEIRYKRRNVFGKILTVSDKATFDNEKDMNRVIDIAFAKLCEAPENMVVMNGPEKIVFGWSDKDSYKKDEVTFRYGKKKLSFDRTRAISFAKQYAEKAMKMGYNIPA